MAYLPIILFLLSLWRYSPEPTVILPPPTGIFQDYGFEQNDSEKIAPIVKLLHDGAYKIIETDSSYASGMDTSIFNIYSRDDSVIIEEQHVYNNMPERRLTQAFSQRGNLLLRSSKQFWEYFNSDGSWVEYRQLHPSGSNHWLDSTILKQKITYDKLGRPIEGNVFDENEEFMQYGKIARKILFTYSRSSIESNDYIRRSGDRYQKSKIELEQERRNGPVEYALYTRVVQKIDSIARSIETETYEYNNEYSKIYNWTYDVINYDKRWHPVKEKIQTRYPNGSEVSEKTIDYIRDSNGLLQEQISSSYNERETTGRWQYDKNGRCVKYESYGRLQDTWTYDAKGNLVEHIHNGDKNRYKIFYK